jgi:hypothetical protein
MPFFIGYAILGQALFWEIEFRFGSFSFAFFSLFAMMNGDKLEMWHNCSNCGHEGFAEDCQLNEDGCNECNEVEES